jgi:hypothetical protein
MIFLAILLGLALALLVLAAGAQVILWNVADIVAHGPSFWPIFWILLILCLLLGGAGKASK